MTKTIFYYNQSGEWSKVVRSFKRLLYIFLLMILIGLVAIIVFHLLESERDKTPVGFPTSNNPVTNKSLDFCKNNVITILSIDGGGTKSIIPLYFLSKIEENTHQSIRKNFDLMGGVSAGGLIVSALSLPNARNQPAYSATDLAKIYSSLSESLFNISWFQKILSVDGLLNLKFNTRLKYDIIKKYFPENLYMTNLLGHTMIFGVDAKNNKILSFCSWKNCRGLTKNYSLNVIISGITSPFGYFAPQILGDDTKTVSHVLGDASYAMKNPTLMIYEYGKVLCRNQKQYLLLSLGSGKLSDSVSLQTEDATHWGYLHWIFYIFVDLYFGARDEIDDLLTKLSGYQENQLVYVRIDPTLPQNLQSQFKYSKKSQDEALQISRQFYITHQPLFQCIDRILTTKHITLQCKNIIAKYQQSTGA